MFVYHEKQMENMSLCGQHCVNNLLQGADFGPGDLGQIARALDRKEHTLTATDELITPSSSGVEFIHSDQRTGFFSVEVLRIALNMRGYTMNASTSSGVAESMLEPQKVNGGNHGIDQV
jgi:ataxin-3